MCRHPVYSDKLTATQVSKLTPTPIPLPIAQIHTVKKTMILQNRGNEFNKFHEKPITLALPNVLRLAFNPNMCRKIGKPSRFLPQNRRSFLSAETEKPFRRQQIPALAG